MKIIDQASSAKFICAMSPDWSWLLQHIESEDGYVRFPAKFSRIVKNLKIDNCPELYEDESFIGKIMLLDFFYSEQIKSLDAELVALSPADRSDRVLKLVREMEVITDQIVVPKTPGQQRRAIDAFNALTLSKRTPRRI